MLKKKIGLGAIQGSKLEIQQEIDAFQYEIDNQRRFGTTNSELLPVKIRIRSLKQDMKVMDIKPTFEFSY